MSGVVLGEERGPSTTPPSGDSLLRVLPREGTWQLHRVQSDQDIRLTPFSILPPEPLGLLPREPPLPPCPTLCVNKTSTLGGGGA